VLTGQQVREVLRSALPPLIPLRREDPSQPAVDYRFADGLGVVGFINPVSQPFCQDCNRLRLTAEGMLRNCLFSTVEWDVRPSLLRGDAEDQQLAQLACQCTLAKKSGHGIDSPEFVRPERAMYQIGG
jgi:cyclic pyranopterin phosphate synthase